MKFTYLKTIGFRKFKYEFETELYNITQITGGNSKGKTNILYAIIWGFLGTNLSGDDKVWLGNKDSDDCLVEIHFIDNLNTNHTLIRYKNKYNSKKNFILLDSKKIEQSDLQCFYCDKKLFLSILNPNYFLSQKPAEQKALLDRYLPNIDIYTIYNALNDEEKKCLEGCPSNILEYLKELNESKMLYENKIKNLQGKVEYAESIIANTIIEDKLVFEKEEELSLARQELSFLSTNFSSSIRLKQEKVVANINSHIKQLESQIKNLNNELVAGKKTYLSIKNSALNSCPLCGQQIENDSKSNTLNNLRKQLQEIYQNRLKFEKELSTLNNNISVEKIKLQSISEPSNEDKSEQIKKIQSQIVTLENEQKIILEHNNSIRLKEQSLNNAKHDVSTFVSQINEYNVFLDNIKQAKQVAQKLLINYLEEKMKFASRYLKNVKIRYYRILKEDGQIKEDFIILYNNNELKMLSKSETIATSLELCNMLNKIANTNLPLFIDDSECCADYDFINDYSKEGQILISNVQKGQNLTIKNYTNTETMPFAA